MSVSSPDLMMEDEVTSPEPTADWVTTPGLQERTNERIYRITSATDYLSVPILGYITPHLVAITVITNSLVVIVLMKRNMKSPTNCVLIGMALSDMFTGLIPMPIYVYFYTTGYYRDYMPSWSCGIYRIFTDIVPTIFHTASIWLTLALAVQRYIYVCHSFKARTWCTIDNVIKGTVVIYVFATLIQILRFFEYHYRTIEVQSVIYENKTVYGCQVVRSDWLVRWQKIYYNCYYWFRVIFVHFIPCTALVVLNALLINAMRQAKKRRELLLMQNKRSESKNIKDTNCTTLMLVAVVGLFLVVELPLGIIMLINNIQNTLDIRIINHKALSVVGQIVNMMILLSYPLNFFIYCAMSKQFRNTFKQLFCGGPLPMDRECSQYMTLPTENGKTVTTGAETQL